MSYANGNIPTSALGDIPGPNAGLIKEAALAYTAMDAATPVSLALVDGSVGRTYRSYSRQVLAKQIYGRNAAVPGTSNHGWGLAVDLMSYAQRQAIDRIGARFGWSKAWSDASWEWWHLRYRSGVWKPRPDPLRILAPHQRQTASTLLFRRRKRKAEARTGRGRRWRYWNRLVKRSERKVERQWRRADRAARKAVLRRVLDDRDGLLN